MVRRRSTSTGEMRKRIMSSLVPAILGAVAGYLYGVYLVRPDITQPGADAVAEVIENRVLPAMYGCMGAILGILAVRLVALFRTIFGDYFQKKK